MNDELTDIGLQRFKKIQMTMIYPKFKHAIFSFDFKSVTYDVAFYPTKDKNIYNVEILTVNLGEKKIITEETTVNRSNALRILTIHLTIKTPIKKSGVKKDSLDKFKEVNSICKTAVEKHHKGLQNDIQNVLSRYRKKWGYLKRREPNYVQSNKDEFDIDGDEYTAIICAGIYKNAPFADRIEFLANFLQRTEQQIKELLFYHYNRYNSFIDNDFYQEVFVEFETHISLYFTKFYKPNYFYGH